MTGSTGPKLIYHVEDEREPVLVPQLADALRARTELQDRVAHLQRLRGALVGGDVNDFLAATNALSEGLVWHATQAANLKNINDQAEAWLTVLPQEMRRIREVYIATSGIDPKATRLEAVEVRGSRGRGADAGYFAADLVDGTKGYLQRRTDDCLQAAIATFLQTPTHTVPDLKLGAMMAARRDPEQIGRIIADTLGAWSEKNAVEFIAHPARLPTTDSRWIGVVDANDDDISNSHCVLMQAREVIFDTAWLTPPRKGEPLAWHTIDDVSLALTIERR